MGTEYEAEARILGGLPVIVVGRVYGAERDVGLTQPYAEVEEMYWTNGGKLPGSIIRRMTKDDDEACEQALLECAE